MKNYNNYIHKHWNEYRHVADDSIDDLWIKNKYDRIGITTRKEWYILKDKKSYVISDYCNNYLLRCKKIEELYEEKGISNINCCLIKPQKGKGPTSKKTNNHDKDEIPIESKPVECLEIYDVFSFNYDDMLSCKPCNHKKWINKVNNISFERKNDMYDGSFKDMYLKFEEQYLNDKKNGNFDKMLYVLLRLATYIEDNDLNKEEKFCDGGVICNIAIITSEYIQTGILDTNINRFKYYTLEMLNSFYTTYVLFIFLNVFTCRQQKRRMTINGEIEREVWYVNLFRKRIINEPLRTTCVIPHYTTDGYGNIKLYCDVYYDTEENENTELDLL